MHGGVAALADKGVAITKLARKTAAASTKKRRIMFSPLPEWLGNA
jgi:hypothetical protein